MKHPGLFVAPFAVALCGATISVAQAQPDPGVAPKAQNPVQAQPFNGPIVRGPLVGGLVAGGALPLMGNVPMMKLFNRGQMPEEMVRTQLAQAGFTDKAVQDPIVEFARAQEKARQPLRDKGQKLAEAARGIVVTDKQMATLINDFRAAVEDEKTRQEQALKELDGKISYTKKPRLEALLLTLGLIGDDAGAFAGGNLPMLFGNAMGNIIVNGQMPGGVQMWANPVPVPGGQPGANQFFGGGGQFFMQPGPNGQAQPFIWGLPPGANPGMNPNIRNFGLPQAGVPGDILQPPPMGEGFVFNPPNVFQWQVKPGQEGAVPAQPRLYRFYQKPNPNLNGAQPQDKLRVVPKFTQPVPAQPAQPVPPRPLPDEPNDELHL